MSLSVDADIAAGTDLLGKVVADLQSGITVGENAITGTLKYVTGYTGFSGDAAEQKGNYLALHAASSGADSITLELIGGVSGRGEVTLDGDGLMIIRISNLNQQVKIRAYKNGVVANSRLYSLAGLTLTPAS